MTAAKSMRVLVVDDNQDTAQGLSLVMRAFGHRAQAVHDGLSAIPAALDYQPDVILLDIGLPGLNGYEVAKRIRAALKDVVIVAVTGWGQTDVGCRRSPSAPLKESTILLAVRRGGAGDDDLLALEGRGIYLQVLDEEDGQLVWNSGNRLLVLVWNSDADLASARQPVMLQCRITTSKAGQNSQLRGTNQSLAPVAGFEAVIWDDTELTAQQNSKRGRRPPVHLWSGRVVQVYDFEFPTAHIDSSQVDGTVRPKYQFHLEVERVVMPTTGSLSKLPEFVWSPESFSVAASRDAARMEETPGYYVEPDREQQIMACLTEVLFVDPQEAKVLPYSNTDRLKVGKRISTHPLHETFLGPEWKEKKLRDEYYHKSEPGALVAELDSHSDSRATNRHDESREDLLRLQRVFTTPIERLVETWREAAHMLRSRKSGPEHVRKEIRSPESD